jgi:hypothetical protein
MSMSPAWAVPGVRLRYREGEEEARPLGKRASEEKKAAGGRG